MKKVTTTLETIRKLAPMMDYKETTLHGILTMNDGSRITSVLNVFEAPEGGMMVNISGSATFTFDNKEEFDKWVERKFELHESQKETERVFSGVDKETWDELWEEWS